MVISLITLSICQVIAYSDYYRSSWIFSTTSAVGLRGFVRGIYWSLWLPFLALPFGVAMIIFAPRWGLPDAALFAGYGLALASLLFSLQLLLVEGLPFTIAPRAERQHLLIGFILFGPLAAGIAWVVQGQFIFRSRLTTAIAAMIFAWAAKGAGDYSLRQLEMKAYDTLAIFPLPQVPPSVESHRVM